MRVCDWYEHLEANPRVIAVSEAQPDGKTWEYAECRTVALQVPPPPMLKQRR